MPAFALPMLPRFFRSGMLGVFFAQQAGLAAYRERRRGSPVGVHIAFSRSRKQIAAPSGALLSVRIQTEQDPRHPAEDGGRVFGTEAGRDRVKPLVEARVGVVGIVRVGGNHGGGSLF